MPLKSPEETVDTLLAELRRAYMLLALIKDALDDAGPDMHLMTPAGAVKMLIVTSEQMREEIKQLEKENNKLRMLTK